METMYKICGTTCLRAALAHAVVGPSAIWGEAQSSTIQRTEVNPCVKNVKLLAEKYAV